VEAAPAAEAAPDTATIAGDTFRPDIEGLRGVAVAMVVLFHAGLVAVAGGFVGVDVFFVISGFLITGLLLRERERRGSISLARFYARRIRRLLPAASVVLVVTAGAAFALVNVLDRPSIMADAIACALSVGNIRFALGAGDYFAAVATPSPLLHFWSLGVEEQFYLVWPLLLIAATRTRRPRVAAAIVLGLVAVVSFGANLAVTDLSPGWSFYSLPTRAWQLALGGLVAIAGDRIDRLPRILRALTGWAGLLAVGIAAVVLDSSVPYPGVAAVLPTAGSLAIVATGATPGGPLRLLASLPLRFLGRVSYSLYLWHWPVFVLVPLALARAMTPAEVSGATAAAVILAALSERYVERPFRHGSPAIAARPRRTIAPGLVAIGVVVAIGGGLLGAADNAIAALDDRGVPGPSGSGIVFESPSASPSPSQSTAPPATPVASGSPGSSASPSASPSPTPAPTPSGPLVTSIVQGVTIRLPGDVRPSLADVRNDSERLLADGCLGVNATTVPPDCTYGNHGGAFTVALVGDSHASYWFNALEPIAVLHGWRLLPFVKISCPFADYTIFNRTLDRAYTECDRFRAATIQRLSAIHPDLLIVENSSGTILPMDPAQQSVAAEGAAIARSINAVGATQVVIIADPPWPGFDVPACLVDHRDDVRACAVPDPWAHPFGAREAVAAKATGGAVLDMTPAWCTAAACPAVVDHVIVWRDEHHLTATFVRLLAPVMDRALIRILGLSG
jgi:peptidoglycan/LPS O-acetylase OafA/YrhL